MLIIEVGAKTSSKYFSRKLPRLTYHKFRLVYAHFYRAHRLHFLINLKIFFIYMEIFTFLQTWKHIQLRCQATSQFLRNGSG